MQRNIDTENNPLQQQSSHGNRTQEAGSVGNVQPEDIQSQANVVAGNQGNNLSGNEQSSAPNNPNVVQGESSRGGSNPSSASETTNARNESGNILFLIVEDTPSTAPRQPELSTLSVNREPSRLPFDPFFLPLYLHLRQLPETRTPKLEREHSASAPNENINQPEEDDDIFKECRNPTSNPLANFIYTGVRRQDLLELSANMESSFRKILLLYLKAASLAFNEDDTNSKKKIDQLHSAMPSVKSLRTYLKITTPSLPDYLLYKFVIDVHAAYGKLFGCPLYKFYRSEVIPLAVDYYQKIDNTSYKKITQKLKQYVRLTEYNNIMLLLSKKEDHLQKYKDEMLIYSNLAEGCSPDMYYA